jgi:hypothetical protein
MNYLSHIMNLSPFLTLKQGSKNIVSGPNVVYFTHQCPFPYNAKYISVLNHGEGVCADPGKGDTTLGVGGPGPPGGDSEHQLSPDRGGGKT